MNDPVNPDSVDAWFARLDSKLDDHKETLTRLTEQVTKTNGRVKRLELWRSFTVGAGAAITTLAGWYVSLKSGK